MQATNSFRVTWAGAPSVSMGASATSDPFIVSSYLQFSVNASWTTTSSPTGTLSIQVCNAPRNTGTILPNAASQSWVPLTALNVAVGSATPPGLQIVAPNCYTWAQLVYTATSGGTTDTLQAVSQGITV